MERQKIKAYQYILGISVLLTGILLFALLSNTLQYLGIVIVILAYIYLVWIFYNNFRGTNDEHLKSRIRDQIMKYQLRK